MIDPLRKIRFLLLAENYQDYIRWCRERMIPTAEVFFVSGAETVKGLPTNQWEAHATTRFWGRKDSSDIIASLHTLFPLNQIQREAELS